MKQILPFAALTLLTLTIACDEKKAAAPAMARPAPAVMVDKVTAQNESQAKDYMGYVEAINTVDIQPRISGYLEKVRFVQGDMVTKDSVLAEIEPGSYRAKRDAAAATVKQMKAELGYAQANHKRQLQLKETNAGTQAALDEAIRLIDFTKGRLEEAQARLTDAEGDYSYTKIYAPLTGRVGRLSTSEGNYVTAASKPLTTIIQVDPIFVRTSISEADYQRSISRSMNDSSLGELKIDLHLADGTLYDAAWRIAVVDNKVQSGDGTVTLWLEYKNPKELLKHGGYVTVSLSEIFKFKYPAVKSTAVLNDKNTSYVYVVNDSGIALRRNIIERERVNDMVLVSSGLEVNEVVVTDGLNKVIPGAPVRPTFAQPATR